MWASDNEGKGSENALGVKEVGELLLRNVLKFKNKIKKEMYSEDNVMNKEWRRRGGPTSLKIYG